MDRIWLEEGPVRLEARFHQATPEVKGTVVICHAHPQYGGSMHNNVVAAVSQAASGEEYAWLKFNFRGVGGSEGVFDNGEGEMEDVRNALAYLGRTCDEAGVRVLAGYSFGAYVASRVAVQDPSVSAFIGIGTPLTVYSMDHLEGVTVPMLLVAGTHDPFCPRDQLLDWVKVRVPAARVEMVKDTDHFFIGREKELADSIGDFLARISHQQS